MPDPHGNVAATETASTAIANAIRYDGYGQTLGTPYVATGAITLDTKYQGRLDVSPSPAFPVYEFSARNLSPTLGTFTSLDTYAGAAQDPASMNRFLYAQANPTTLIDPTGHGTECQIAISCSTADRAVDQQRQQEYQQRKQQAAPSSSAPKPHTTIIAGASTPPVRDTWSMTTETSIAPGFSWAYAGLVAGNVGAGIGGAATASWEFGTGLVGGLVDLGLCAIPIEGLGCSPAQFVGDLASDWEGTTTAIAHQAAQGIGNARADLLSGDPYRVSHAVTGVFLFVGSAGAGKVPKVPAGAGAGAEAIQPASSVGRAGSYLDDVGRGCAHSFAAATLVRTADGSLRPIAELAVGDEVSAHDPETGTTGAYAISATFVHDDPVTGSVEIDGETIVTTPGHAFLTVERGWVEAKDLRPGEHVPSITGGNGVVGAIAWDGGRATMYDLTVETVHTFAVGTGGWVVHNCGWPSFPAAKRRLGPAGDGMHWDHIVEQSQIRRTGFDPTVIHSAANLRAVPATINMKRAALYNSIRRDITGSDTLRVRDWLAGQPFEAQYRFGLDWLRLLEGQ